MMKVKEYFLIVLLFTICSNVVAQHRDNPHKNVFFYNSKLYKGYGVIFKKEYVLPIGGFNIIGRFNPSFKEVEIAENILYNQLNERRISNFGKKWKMINVQKKYSKYHRQYFGYYNSKGDKIIYMYLMNFKNQKKFRENFDGWKQEIIPGFGKFYEKNTRMYRINITKKTFEH